MKKFEAAKKVTNLVVGHSAGFATTRLIVANAPTNGSLYERICVVVGAVAVGTMVGSKTSEYTDSVFDQIKAGVDSAKEDTQSK